MCTGNLLFHADQNLLCRREKAVKDLLARSAPKFDEWMTRGIVGSLKIPVAWIDEAKVPGFRSWIYDGDIQYFS